MTGTSRSSEGLDPHRRRLLFRSWHRGIRETDLILGRFADAHIADFGDAELAEYEKLLAVLDHDLYVWVTSPEGAPAEHDTKMFRRLRAFHHRADKST